MKKGKKTNTDKRKGKEQVGKRKNVGWIEQASMTAKTSSSILL